MYHRNYNILNFTCMFLKTVNKILKKSKNIYLTISLSFAIFLLNGGNMNYYNEIKQELISNEINKKIKDYSKNKYELQKYYNVGKLLLEAGKQYGEGIIKEYSKKLINELGKKYSVRYLFDIRKLYVFSKVHPLSAQLTMSHYRLLFPLTNENEINYYINQVMEKNLSKRQLEMIIKSNEYERLPRETKNKLINKEKLNIIDYMKKPIIIKNSNNYDAISEKILQKLILEDIPSFLKEFGIGFAFIDNEYKIKIGDSYNYIDLLLFNYIYNCFVIIELKVTQLKKEHIGQIQTYMNYIDKNLRKANQDKTIGIIVCKKENEFIMEYVSDNRIYQVNYILN